MAVRISELNALSVDLSQADELPIVDVSAAETKKITVANILNVGISGAPSSFIDLSKLDQASITKLSNNILDDTGVASGTYGDAATVAQFVVNSKGVITTATGISIEITASSVTGLAPVATSGTYLSLSGLPTLGTLSSQDANSVAISGGTISGITDLAVEDGGTGASSAADARTNLGLVIGTDVQAYDAGLASIAGLTTAADELIYLTGEDTYATSPLVEFARGLLASGNSASDVRTLLELGALATRAIIGSGDIDSGVIVGSMVASGALISDNYGSESVTTAAISGSAVTSEKIASGTITAEKFANNSSTIVNTGAPLTAGSFIGQQYIDDATYFLYAWDGSVWTRQAALDNISFADSSPLAFSVAYPDANSAVVTTTVDNQAANTIWAGPASGVDASPAFRNLVAEDLPLAADGVVGAVSPGAGLSVDGSGQLGHSNTAEAGVYAGAVTIDSQGHIVSAQPTLQASDIPDLDASKITTGTFTSSFLAENSVTAAQLADYGIAQISETAPTPEFAGQWWINPSDRSAYIWVGEVTPAINGYWLSLGYGSPTQINLRFGGTYNASGNTVESINSYGIEAGLTVGQALSAPNTSNNGVYLIVTASGVGTTPAPAVDLSVGNWILSQGVGASWTQVDLGIVGETISDADVLVNGAGFSPVASGIANQEEFNELVWSRLQIATSGTTGIVRGSNEVLVAASTGIMTIGTVDEGFY